jgi:hypothetical protein
MTGAENNNMTSIGLTFTTKARLADLKDHKRQSFDELLNKLLDEKEARE